MQTANRLPDGFRLACQSQLVNDGELVVRIPESSKLPHLPYTD
jgi:ferredoxin